jgi:hypothetical protein
MSFGVLIGYPPGINGLESGPSASMTEKSAVGAGEDDLSPVTFDSRKSTAACGISDVVRYGEPNRDGNNLEKR